MKSLISFAINLFFMYWMFRLLRVAFKSFQIRIEEAERRVDNYERSKKRKNHQSDTKYYPETGWTWNERTKRWDPPGYKEPEIKVDHTEPTFEEWKANREQQKAANVENVEIDFSNAYQSRNLFTRNEWQNYKKLRDVAEVKGYVICPKVRLLDIIEPRKGEKKYKTLFYKIQSKHVDFVICDQQMNIKAIVELDDSSHDRQDRKERDQFIDLILRSVGYKVIHTRYIDYDILDLV